VEPTQTLELNNEMRSLESQEAQEIQKILADLTQQVRKSIPEQLSNISILGRLDFLNAKARYSVEISGSAPKLTGSRRLRLKKALHPLLLTKHGREEITPLELESGHEYNTLIISGPNAGGKSVAMKTVGLLNVMTQSGCHIPASPDSEIPVFSELFVEMGDDQSIENDLSTFSSHLNNLKIILEHSTTKSLVLIDEIGNGTDPSLGSALGIAVLESLSARDAMTIVTSHHSAFKSCGFEKDKMENAGMGFDTETLKPNYRISVGMPGNSYALEIAKNLEFPADTLKRSFELTGEENVKLTEYLTRFESRTNELETLLRKTRTEREKLGETITLYESRIAAVNEEVKDIRSKAHSISQAREEIRKLNKTVAENDEIQETRPDFDISVGQGVKVSGSDAVCEVLEVMPHGRVRILTGGKTIIVQKNQLEPTEDKARTGVVTRKLVELSEAKNEIDLRGLYGDEAINAIDMFIDRALLAGLSQVRIIHGKGTGALRKRVAEYLGGNKKVTSFQLGQWNEGGTGVTVAILGE
jgi:DNA mismatch repair protein MutS2